MVNTSLQLTAFAVPAGQSLLVVHMPDPENNKIALQEPIDTELKIKNEYAYVSHFIDKNGEL
ncbi:MAG: hypothetical protein ABI472_15940 [Ginsengibacter sp.]